MKSTRDLAGKARRAWLKRGGKGALTIEPRSEPQSDFEKAFAFRLTFVVAAFVIAINLLSPDPAVSQPTSHQAAARV
jgi:hypothetical protein